MFAHFLGSPSWRATSNMQKLAICFVMLTITVEIAFGTHDMIFYGITLSDSFEVLGQGTLTECIQPLLTGICGAVVQSVLAARALKVTDKRWVKIVSMTLFSAITLLELLGAVTLTYFEVWYHRGVYDKVIPGGMTFDISLKLWMWCAAAADIIVTGTYVILVHKKRKGQSDAARNVLTLVVQGAIQSASYTLIFALATAVLTQATDPNNIMYYDIPYAFWLPLAPLYGISLFSTLSIGQRVADRVRDSRAVMLEGSQAFQDKSKILSVEDGLNYTGSRISHGSAERGSSV
ncbi:hypothetical protein T439DRAFT_52664 [Meredithblackwellia eburnea MCA 4105]